MATGTASGVTLTLSTDEALTLRMVLAYVGGSADTTRREDVDSIIYALSDAGVHYYPGICEAAPFEQAPQVYGPALIFKDRLETA